MSEVRGVVVVPCENRVPLGNRSLPMRIARRYHFLCPTDLSPLPVLRIEPHGKPFAERRIHFGLCPSCGQKWWGPRLGELATPRSPRRDRRPDGVAEIQEADALAQSEPHDCLTREHDPDEWCPDCFPIKKVA